MVSVVHGIKQNKTTKKKKKSDYIRPESTRINTSMMNEIKGPGQEKWNLRAQKIFLKFGVVGSAGWNIS